MPKALERKLLKEAKKRGYSKKRTGAYVYGTLRKTGWTPSKKKKGKKKKKNSLNWHPAMRTHEAPRGRK